MILFVWGFTTKKQALQFEFAWQHPLGVRGFKDKVRELPFLSRRKSGRREVRLHWGKEVEVLSVLLGVEPWRRMGLKIAWLGGEAGNLPVNRLASFLAPAMEFSRLPSLLALHSLLTAQTQQQNRITACSCSSCVKEFQIGDRVTTCPSCGRPCHVLCARAEKAALIPENGLCPACLVATVWGLWISRAQTVTEDTIDSFKYETALEEIHADSSWSGSEGTWYDNEVEFDNSIGQEGSDPDSSRDSIPKPLSVTYTDEENQIPIHENPPIDLTQDPMRRSSYAIETSPRKRKSSRRVSSSVVVVSD